MTALSKEQLAEIRESLADDCVCDSCTVKRALLAHIDALSPATAVTLYPQLYVGEFTSLSVGKDGVAYAVEAEALYQLMRGHVMRNDPPYAAPAREKAT